MSVCLSTSEHPIPGSGTDQRLEKIGSFAEQPHGHAHTLCFLALPLLFIFSPLFSPLLSSSFSSLPFVSTYPHTHCTLLIHSALHSIARLNAAPVGTFAPSPSAPTSEHSAPGQSRAAFIPVVIFALLACFHSPRLRLASTVHCPDYCSRSRPGPCPRTPFGSASLALSPRHVGDARATLASLAEPDYRCVSVAATQAKPIPSTSESVPRPRHGPPASPASTAATTIASSPQRVSAPTAVQ